MRQSAAYQALARISTIYKLKRTLRELSGEKRLKERKTSIKPLVEEYFAWVKERLEESCLPKGKTAHGLKYSVNQEAYLKVFLENGDIPIDNSASERSIRTFCEGKKNWVLINAVKGTQASAAIYSITETTKLNELNPYYYIKYLLERIPELINAKGAIAAKDLEQLLSWSESLPAKCHRIRL